MTENLELEKRNEGLMKAYSSLLYSGILLHVIFFVSFRSMGYNFLFFYNIASIFFYIIVLGILRKNQALSMKLSLSEAPIFITLCVLTLGWDYGFQNFYFQFAILLYVISVNINWEIGKKLYFVNCILYVATYLMSSPNTGVLQRPDDITKYVYIINTVVSFFGFLIALRSLGLIKALLQYYEYLELENENLKNLARYDELTGLINRRSALKIMDSKFEKVAKGDALVGLAFGDIDDFKLINDTYGHDYGDYMLKSIGQILEREFHDSGNVIRWGGEEFLLIRNIESPEEFFQEIESIRKVIEKQKMVYKKVQMSCTMTFGCAISQKDMGPEDILMEADRLMYLGKKRGKNMVVTED